MACALCVSSEAVLRVAAAADRSGSSMPSSVPSTTVLAASMRKPRERLVEMLSRNSRYRWSGTAPERASSGRSIRAAYSGAIERIESHKATWGVPCVGSRSACVTVRTPIRNDMAHGCRIPVTRSPIRMWTSSRGRFEME